MPVTRLVSAIVVCCLLALSTASVDAQDDTAPADDYKAIQGKWLRVYQDAQGVQFRVLKETMADTETVQVFRGEELIHEHTVTYTLRKTGDVRIFTYSNYRITAGPNKGVVRNAPVSFLYQVRGDRLICIQGMLNEDPAQLNVEVYGRVDEVEL